MSRGVELVVLFVDGLDHDFVLRNLAGSDELRRLFPPEQIHRIQGVLHSLDCLGQLFTGRNLSVFQFQNFESIPCSAGLVNWDILLSHVPKEELIWNRLNRADIKVGLVEMLGVCLSPALDGFSVTKNLAPIGLRGLFLQKLSHHPAAAGDLFAALCEEHGYPRPPKSCIVPASDLLTGPAEELTAAEARAVIEQAGCHRLPGIIDDNLDRLVTILEGLTRRHPVQALFMHTGYFDSLLHLFFGQPEQEARIITSLDRLLRNLRETFAPRELLIFSDHGMAPTKPHLAGNLLHRTYHKRDEAVLMGAGERLTSYLKENPPCDLTAVYHGVLSVFGAGPATAEPPTAEQVTDQLQEVLVHREHLMRKLSRLLDEE